MYKSQICIKTVPEIDEIWGKLQETSFQYYRLGRLKSWSSRFQEIFPFIEVFVVLTMPSRPIKSNPLMSALNVVQNSPPHFL